MLLRRIVLYIYLGFADVSNLLNIFEYFSFICLDEFVSCTSIFTIVFFLFFFIIILSSLISRIKLKSSNDIVFSSQGGKSSGFRGHQQEVQQSGKPRLFQVHGFGPDSKKALEVISFCFL